MKRYMYRPSSWGFPELRPSFRLISKGEAKICQQCQAQLMEGTRFLFCPQCETSVPRNFAYENPEYQEAIEHCTEAIHLDPNHSRAYYGRGAAYHNMGQYQRAIEDYDKAIQLDPDDAWAYSGRGYAYRALGPTPAGHPGLRQGHPATTKCQELPQPWCCLLLARRQPSCHCRLH